MLKINFDELLPEVIPVVIACILTALFTIWIYSWQRQHEEETFEKSLILSLYTEIKTLWKLYAYFLITELRNLKPYEYSQLAFEWSFDFFCIYHSNTANLGRIKDTQLRTAIIRLYTLLKKFLEDLKIYKGYIEEYGEAKSKFINYLAPYTDRYLQEDDLIHILKNIEQQEAMVTITSVGYEKQINCHKEVITILNKILQSPELDIAENMYHQIIKYKKYDENMQQLLKEETKELQEELKAIIQDIHTIFRIINKKKKPGKIQALLRKIQALLNTKVDLATRIDLTTKYPFCLVIANGQ